jgi:hypothetical protein
MDGGQKKCMLPLTCSWVNCCFAGLALAADILVVALLLMVALLVLSLHVLLKSCRKSLHV